MSLLGGCSRAVRFVPHRTLRGLRLARRHAPRFLSRQVYICGDVERLPLAAESIDLAFSNLSLQ
ncbi:MAG: methyltransferase domain-containing protein, partial [Nitrososphaera sp.]